MTRQRAIGLGLATTLLFVAGCGGSGPEPTASVTGTVTYQGELVEGASVAFMPQSGRPASGVTDASGKFTLSTFRPGDGALLGDHKVVIVEATIDLVPGPGEPGFDPAGTTGRFPARYANPEQSGFTAKVEARKKNEFTFDMVE